jgi:hypothetical protein|tara:strand:+ start:379 stop:603 length:225 start_codon:yes stop_codon:yes gene_type:complete
VTPKEVIALLITAAEEQAKAHLPSYIQDSWVAALADLLERGLYHAWIEVIENLQLVQLEADEITITDKRGKEDA